MRKIIYLLLLFIIILPQGINANSYEFGNELRKGDYLEYGGQVFIGVKYNVSLRVTFLVKEINESFIQFELRVYMNGEIINTGDPYTKSIIKQVFYERDTQIFYYNNTVVGMFSLFRNTSWTGKDFLMGWTNSTKIYGNIISQDNVLWGKFGFQNSYHILAHSEDFPISWNVYYDNDTGYLLSIEPYDPVFLNLINLNSRDVTGDLDILDASVSFGPPYIPTNYVKPEGALIIGGIIFGASYFIIKKSRAGHRKQKPIKPKRIKSRKY